MRSILGVLIATTFLASVQGAQAPLQQAWPSSDIERFVPIGWVSTQSVLGDLNGDGVADAASVLLRNEAVNGNPVEQAGSRGLLVLFASPVGGYRFQDFAPEALPCASCLGDREGDPQAPVFELTIADGRLTVGWRRDAGVPTEVKLVIGYDPERGMLRLLGDEILTADPISGKVVTQARDYQVGIATTDGRESRFSPKIIPLIDISADDY